MKRLLPLFLSGALLLPPDVAWARGHGGAYSHSSRSQSGSRSSYRSSGTHASEYRRHGSGSGVRRTSHGKFKRDPAQRAAFMRSHPCPATGKAHGACPGYVVDHVQALKHGGADSPGNMQ